MLGAVTSSSNGMLEVLHTQILDKETIDMESDDIIQRVIQWSSQGGLRGLEHPLSKKKKKIAMLDILKIIIGNALVNYTQK